VNIFKEIVLLIQHLRTISKEINNSTDYAFQFVDKFKKSLLEIGVTPTGRKG